MLKRVLCGFPYCLHPINPPCLLGCCLHLKQFTGWSTVGPDFIKVDLFKGNQSLFGCIFLTAALTWAFFTLNNNTESFWAESTRLRPLFSQHVDLWWHCLLHTFEDSLWWRSDHVSILQMSPLWDKPLGETHTFMFMECHLVWLNYSNTHKIFICSRVSMITVALEWQIIKFLLSVSLLV